MEKLEIIVFEPVPMDLGNVSGHDTKSTQGDSDMSNDMSYEDVCAIAWKGYKAGKGAGKKDRTGQDRGIVEKELMNGRVAREMTEADWYSDKNKGSKGKGKGKSKGKSETRYCYDRGEQGHIGVNCPYKWANSIDEEDDQTSSWESEPEEGENAEELASLETPDAEGERCWPEKKQSHQVEEED